MELDQKNNNIYGFEMKQFSKETLKKLTPCEKCKYYVYRLIDPRNFETFYVGKGCGNRVFQHSEACKNLISKNEDAFSLKFDKIREILNAQKEVICIIHRWGLTEEEAFEVEAALIDCYPRLTNIQSGHGLDRGVITVADFETLCNKKEYQEPQEDYIIIKTTQGAINLHGNLYDATHQAWRGSINRAQKYKYVLSVVYGEVMEVYEVDNNGWYKIGNRIGFNGKVTANPDMRALVGQLLPSKYMERGMANPFLYKKK